GVSAQQDNVGLLAWGYRADEIIEASDPSSAGRHPRQRIATRQRRTLGSTAGLRQCRHNSAIALVLQRQPHAGKQVSAYSGFHISSYGDRSIRRVQDAGE